MKAVGYEEAGPASQVLVELDIDSPRPGPRDLVIGVRGVSVNPADVKLRASESPSGEHRILGFDASGVVKEVGPNVTRYRVGDEVFYAGDITRPGTNAEYHAVDERIVGRKPSSLNFTEAAGMALTSITAWEILFECLHLREGEGGGEALLVVGGAGGVGSILIQLAKQLTGLTVVGTASRADTQEWVKQMGADHVVNHRNPLDQEMDNLGISPRYVASLTHTDTHFDAIRELIKPRGRIALTDDPETLDIVSLKTKAISVSWELMFTRPMFETDDIEKQRQLLNRVADLLDDGVLRSTVNRQLGALSADTLRRAHELQESGEAIGKTVLEGLGD